MTRIGCAADVRFSRKEIAESSLFKDWLAGFGPEWTVEHVYVSGVFARDHEIRIAFIRVTAIDPQGQRRTNLALLRGRTVVILPVIAGPDGSEYAVLVEQARAAVGQMVISTPAGMVDDGYDVQSTALKEMAEEVGGDIAWSEPVWLNHVATGSDAPMWVSPGGTDEKVQYCTIRANLTQEQIEALQGRQAGAQDEGERTQVHVVPMPVVGHYLAQQGPASEKSVMSWLLYRLWRQSPSNTTPLARKSSGLRAGGFLVFL